MASVHEIGQKLITRIGMEANNPFQSLELAQLLIGLGKGLADALSNPKETCTWVEQFLLPFWKKGENGEYYFDRDAEALRSRSTRDQMLSDAEEKTKKKIDREAIYKQEEALNKATVFMYDYFEAMCDFYTAK